MKFSTVVVKTRQFSQFRRFCSSRQGTCDNSAWQINGYGGVEQLQKNEISLPIVTRPDQVVVKVHAASVNPIDVAITGGYGATVLNLLRKADACSADASEFPLTLGRDFAGTVVRKGQNVRDLSEGDEVWGVLAPHLQGSHAEFVLAPSEMVCKKPTNLSMIDAGSMLYAAMTAWSALQITGMLSAVADLPVLPLGAIQNLPPPKGGLAVLGATGRRVLVLGGSGGVGTSAVQLLQAWGAQVTATCSSNAVSLLQTLGVTSTIDYTLPDIHQRLDDTGKFDVILDCAGLGTEYGKQYLPHLSQSPFAKFITLKSPLLRAIDVNGLVAGSLSSLASLVQANFPADLQPRLAPVRWAFFLPLPFALNDITQLASQSRLKPCINAVFEYDKLPSAFEKQKDGHARGKIVIKMTD